jgi:hypothetical protein
MVYLVRTCRFLKDWEKAWKSIAGPIDELHWVVAFDSLADEERFALKAMEDEVYGKTFMDFEGRLTPFVDRLYRRK